MLKFLTENPARIRKRDCKYDHDEQDKYQGLEIIKVPFPLFLHFVILTYLSLNKHGGFVAMGGPTKEVISRKLRFSAGRMFPLTFSGIFSMTELVCI